MAPNVSWGVWRVQWHSVTNSNLIAKEVEDWIVIPLVAVALFLSAVASVSLVFKH